MRGIAGKLFIYTVATKAGEIARKYDFGLEIAEYCTAYNMDTGFETYAPLVRGKMRDIGRCTFHAPFNELCPAAIDPLIVDVARRRYGKIDTHNALGDGIIDVAEVIRMIAETSPDVTFTIETDSAEMSVEWLKSNGFI